jgi:periodic tryptophan protein 2
VLAAAGRHGTVRMWTLHRQPDYEPVTLAGHKRAVVGVYFVSPASDDDDDSSRNRLETCYSVSEDGALVTWRCTYAGDENSTKLPGPTQEMDEDDAEMGDDAVGFFTGTGGADDPTTNRGRSRPSCSSSTVASQLAHGTWSVASRHYFRQEGGVLVTSTAYCDHAGGGALLAVGFSSGLFGLYEMPSVANIHTLSVGANQLVRSCVLNRSGDWLALACPASQQVLVWEWRSETYVLKQRGHAYGMRCMAWSPDGIIVCTGGEDGKIKLWNAQTGFCYVTLNKSHTAPVTAVAFAKSSVVLSASLDGTVRAHDLHRYRTFQTLTTPTPVQFWSLAVDPSGEIVTAGSSDPFHIYVWNLQTATLLDVLTGHSGPVCGLAFPPADASSSVLVSASWDGTCRTWSLFQGKSVPTETLQHNTDCVCVAVRPDGKEICSGTVGGLLSFWNVETGRLKFEIDGRRDIAGGRKMNDRMTADNNAASRYFTSVCYSADGSCVLAGGNSKYVCIYEVSQRMLLKKFQVTFNRSLDGVLDEVR